MPRPGKVALKRTIRGQGGFTLIEMLIVVGIIVVLAAVVVPKNLRFIDSGEQGAKAQESENVQTALDSMMIERAIITVDPHDLGSSSTAIQNWSALPTGPNALPLAGYLHSPTTTYFYCFNVDGDVTEQFESAAACTQ